MITTRTIMLDEKVYLSEKEFNALSDYSCSIPTGTTLGKRWKRDLNAPRRFHRVEPDAPPNWCMGEYVPDTDPKFVGIRWRKIIVVKGKLDPKLQRKIDAAEARWRDR